MVATTPVFLWTLTNLGPLTSTFTAEQSCATRTDGVMVATALPSGGPVMVKYPGTCGKNVLMDKCLPDGDKLDEVYKDKNPLYYNPETAYRMPVYSPGVLCPSGWTTAGAITKQPDGKIASPTGFFEPNPAINASALSQWTSGVVVPPATALATALEPSETAAACCPSAWTAHAGGFCYSGLPKDKFPATAGCYTYQADMGGTGLADTVTTTIDIAGVTSASVELLKPTYSGEGKLTTLSYTDATDSKLFPVTTTPAVYLIHKAEETVMTTGGSGGPTGTNAAVAMTPGGPDSKALGGLVLVVVTAAMAGAAAMMPW